MKKLLLCFLLLPSLSLASGPKYTFRNTPGLDDEMNNVYHDIKYPILQYGVFATLQSASSNTAQAGTIRLSNAIDSINFRNNSNNGDISLGLNGGNQLTLSSPGTLLLFTTSNQIALGGSGSTNIITVTAPTPAAGRTYTIPDAGANANFLLTTTGSTVVKAPSVQKFTSGSGTYTTPTSPSPVYIRVRMVGGGGGGGGSGTNGGSIASGTGGGNSTFGTSLLVANGGAGGPGGGDSLSGAGGGTASLGTGPIGIALTGGSGNSGVINAATLASAPGGSGGNSAFGGGGGSVIAAAGAAGVANTGGGGSGAGGALAYQGLGGGAGGYIDAMIASPSATYSYAVGAGNAGGTAGTSGFAGGAGGSGLIEVEEFYQ